MNNQNNTSIEELVEILKKIKLTVSVAESCTGGMVASSIVNVAGASNIFNESYVTYSNEAKHRILGVKEETLEKYGAVSEQTAEEMARGCMSAAGADVGISTTGIAGPDGGTKEKPVGLVYIGCIVGNRVFIEKNIFKGDRLTVRRQAAEKAIINTIKTLKEEYHELI